MAMPVVSSKTLLYLPKRLKHYCHNFQQHQITPGGWFSKTGSRLAYRSVPAKGMQIGGAAVHRQQALVLINEDNAKSEDVVQLAHHVRQKVGEKFNVWLEPEVRFIGASGEVSAVETIS